MNIIIGIVFVIGGLSGRLALLGTNSSLAITVLGAGLIVWGGYKMIQRRARD